MPFCGFSAMRAARSIAIFTLVLVLCVSFSHVAFAQDTGDGDNGGTSNFNFSRSAVGGIMIDANGVLKNASVDQTGELRRLLAENADAVPGDLNRPTRLRKVSLRRLGEAIRECRESGKPLPDDILYLAGLQKIRYVFVYPDKNDIVLAGPGEGWQIDDKGRLVVGVESGRPVLLLDDLLVALRTAREAQRMAISCSIDPSAEGLMRLQNVMKQLAQVYRRTNSLGNQQQAFARIEQALGPQKIAVTVVPPTSHFARVLVAADFRMKRIAMNFDPSPISGLPSFMHMLLIKKTKTRNMLPRWWLEPQYETATRDPSGMAWELGDTAVKAMTEDDFLSSTGEKKHSGRADPLAQQWADNMTAKYDELAAADPIFAELQNVMSLAVVGALVAKEDLAQKANVDMTTLMDPTETPVLEFNAPKQVDSKVSWVKKHRELIISTSGGVDINSWAALERSERKRKA